MKINYEPNKYINFGIYVSPKMKYTLFKETKKFYTRKEAKNLLTLIESSSDKYNLDMFKMNMPNKREKSIFCDLFITPKTKNGKSCLIHTFLGKKNNKQIQYNPLARIINNI